MRRRGSGDVVDCSVLHLDSNVDTRKADVEGRRSALVVVSDSRAWHNEGGKRLFILL